MPISNPVCFVSGDELPDLFFGNASNGNVTLTGSLATAQDSYYDTLTIDGGNLNTNGYRVFARKIIFKGTNPTIHCNGSNGGNGGAGSAGSGGSGGGGVSNKTLGAGVTGGNGGDSSSPNGASGTNNANVYGSASNSYGGSGGNGDVGIGGGGGLITGYTAYGFPKNNLCDLINQFHYIRSGSSFNINAIMAGAGGGGGGWSNGGGSDSAGGGGGGGGGGFALIIVKEIELQSNALISANGGAGGNGGVSGSAQGGGGGGGGGGTVILAYKTLTTGGYTLTKQCAGGAGGTGYQNGQTGNAGNFYEIVIS